MTTKDITVPDIGDFENVEIIDISVSVGDTVAEEDSLITLETDKAAMDIPSPHAGKITELKVSVGDKVSQGDAIIAIALDDESSAESSEPSQEQAPGKTESPAAAEPAKASTEPTRTTRVESQEVKVPDLGTDDAVEIIEVLVSEGDTVEAEQSLITLESEKASMEVPSPSAGAIENIKVKVGDKVQTGDVILSLKSEQSTSMESQAEATPEASSTSETKEAPAAGHQEEVQHVKRTSQQPVNAPKVHAGPATRRLANELGVNLSLVTGTGRKGRIVLSDIHQFVKKSLNEKSAGSTMGVEPMPEVDFSKFGEIDVQPLNRIKKLTAKYMHRNWVHIPHVTQFDEADITELEAFRKENKKSAESLGVKLTPLAFIVKAVSSALQAFPQFNASLSHDGQSLVTKKYFHMGIAVDTPNGLVVPVIRDVDRKGIFAIAREIVDSSKKAQEGKLAANDMQGGCFSISSLGSLGGTAFTPIINAPEVAILGVSKSAMKPVYQDGQFQARLMMPLSLSYDHRVIDGAEAVKFLLHVKEQLQDIRKLIL